MNMSVNIFPIIFEAHRKMHFDSKMDKSTFPSTWFFFFSLNAFVFFSCEMEIYTVFNQFRRKNSSKSDPFAGHKMEYDTQLGVDK